MTSRIRKGTKGTEPDTDLLISQPTVLKVLRRMVARMDVNPDDHEDLMQEALLHLWAVQYQHPKQHLTWYLQNVKFHLHNLARRGRSLDSPPRNAARASFPANYEWREQWPDTLELDDNMMSELIACDLAQVLKKKLDPIDRTILEALVKGLRVGEIAERLRVSHAFVTKHRHSIARVAMNLGVSPVPSHHAHRGSSTKSK